MKNVLAFFRDTLNGPLYYGVSLVCFILICICIYILRRIDLKEKKAEKEAISSRVVLLDTSGSNQTVEVSLNAVEDAGGQVLTNVTNVLAAQDIYSGSVSNDTNSSVVTKGVVDNIDSTDVLAIETPVVQDEEVLEEEPVKPKAPVMINPDEVAMVSSTLNVMGTSEQMSAMNANSIDDGAPVIPHNNVQNVISQQEQ